MITVKNDFPVSGCPLDHADFSPNEPGVPFGDNLAHQVNMICRQFGDSKTPALPPIRLSSVANPDIYEVMERGGDLIHVEACHAIA